MLRIYIMLLFILNWAIISFILIVLIHYLYSFFKSTLTIPKVRDLVNKPTERYNEMIDTIKYNDTIKYKDNNNKQDNMQDELSNFLQDLKKNKNVSSEIISSNKIVSSSEIVSSSSGHSNTFSNY
jgi:hypothetical protein